jgi:hypothetical protein
MIPKELFLDLRRQRPARGPGKTSILSSLETLFIEHPIFEKAEREIAAAIDLHGIASTLPNLQISGVSGVGKTTLIKKLLAKYPPISNGRSFTLADGALARCDEVPLLRVEMPVKPSSESLARAFLKAFGDPKHASGDKKSVEERVQIYTFAKGTKAFLIDEAQRAVDRNGTIVKQELAFWLQELYENNYVSIFIVGLGRTNFLFEQDSQVERRWDAEIRMVPYAWGGPDTEPESRVHFIALLMAFKENFPLPWPDELDLEDDINCMRFFYASRGVVGLLKKLLHSLLRLVIQENLESVDRTHFSTAFARAFRKEIKGAQLEDPFGRDWEPVLPPPLADDTKLINHPRRKGKLTAKEKKAELTYVLTAT